MSLSLWKKKEALLWIQEPFSGIFDSSVFSARELSPGLVFTNAGVLWNSVFLSSDREMDAIGTLLYMCCRSLTFSSSTSSSGAADSVTAVDDVNIPPLREKYDVFISFRGEDTRLTFTSHLHAALRGKKIETYMDDRLERGDEIGPALREAIEKSRLSVIIFSKNYASSTWCLIELVHILKCKKKNGHMVVPIFYDISPSDVRKQEGSYADAFAKLENRFKDTMDKVIEWKDALVEATGLSGFDYSNKKGTEADFIKNVVEDISTKLKRETSCDLKGMVGIERYIEQVELLLSWQGVRTVGIWGMGGIGKTTLAKAVFNRLSSEFEASCFLKNVREKSEQTDGADQLQNTLLREILKEENLSIDKKNVKERLARTKVLIVFDDVSDWRQIKDLVGHYEDGSRIIVTSRERGVLKKAVSDEKYIYQVQTIKTDDALRLFQLHALKDNSPREEYTELSERVVQYAGGIPLALEVLGSLFFERESKQEWEEAWSTLRNYPNEEIQLTFKASYNRLPRNAQMVFLDIEYKEKTKRSSAFYDRVTEVSVHFRLDKGLGFNTAVGKYGMCRLYAEDAEKLKCRVMSQQEQDEHAASGSGDPEASGSNESEEASGSDDSEEESGGGDLEASGSDDSEGESGRRGSKRRQLVLEEMSQMQVEGIKVEGINLLLV